MNAAEIKSRVVPLVMSGARGGSLDAELKALGGDRDQALLNAISLAGQALRFTRPAQPAEYAVETWPHDERPIVPQALRAPILRLLDRCTEDTVRALALALEERHLRPHPFDLPKMDGLVRRYADRLGVTAQYWVQRETKSAAPRGYFDAVELNAETWTEATPRVRAKFLRELRKRDAEAARMLLEKTWNAEDADSRAQLIATLQTGLLASDKGFLEKIRKDRAPRVRAAVERFLAALSGSAADNPALAACMERIERSKSGLLKKRQTLKLELPATVKEHEAARWIEEQFRDVTIAELARACELADAEELVEAAKKDENLLFALSLMVTREKRFELLETIADEIPDAWGRMSDSNFEDTSLDDSAERAQWARAIVTPKKWLPSLPFPAWSWLHRQMEGPLPVNVMREVLTSKAWTAQLEEEKKPGTELVQVFCALCPSELRSHLRTQLEPLNADRNDKGLMLLEILESLEKTA
jgi:Family of unknown function (DUF5691)